MMSQLVSSLICGLVSGQLENSVHARIHHPVLSYSRLPSRTRTSICVSTAQQQDKEGPARWRGPSTTHDPFHGSTMQFSDAVRVCSKTTNTVAVGIPVYCMYWLRNRVLCPCVQAVLDHNNK